MVNGILQIPICVLSLCQTLGVTLFFKGDERDVPWALELRAWLASCWQ